MQNITELLYDIQPTSHYFSYEAFKLILSVFLQFLEKTYQTCMDV